MLKLFEIGLIVTAVLALAVGDIFLKKASQESTLLHAVKSPWMFVAIGLYLYQIIFVTYVFIVGWDLSVVGTMQAAVYALVVVLAGIFFFKESLTTTQLLGVLLATAGVLLINH